MKSRNIIFINMYLYKYIFFSNLLNHFFNIQKSWKLALLEICTIL